MTREKYHGGHGDVRRTLHRSPVAGIGGARGSWLEAHLPVLIVPALGGAHQWEAPVVHQPQGVQEPIVESRARRHSENLAKFTHCSLRAENQDRGA